MEAKELRIGNWIYHESEEKNNPFTVEVDLQDLEFISRGDISYSPIPLTPEILEMAGFEVPDGYNDTVLYKDGIMIDFHLGEYKLRENNRVKLKYLHQLQNLYFALTGEELKIEL